RTLETLSELCLLHIHVITDSGARKRTDTGTDQRVLELVALRQEPSDCASRCADAGALDRFAGLRLPCVWIDGRATACGKYQEGANTHPFDERILHISSPVLVLLVSSFRSSVTSWR